MTIYLDTCSMQRPLDDRGQLRIRLEAEAILSVLDLVEAGTIELVTSDAVQFETDRNPYPTRQQFAREMMVRPRLTSHCRKPSRSKPVCSTKTAFGR